MRVKEIGQKDGIMVREIDGKIYAGGTMAWIALAIELYKEEGKKHRGEE